MADGVLINSGENVDDASLIQVATRFLNGKHYQEVLTKSDDGAGIDAFARLRVSQPILLLDSKRVGGVPDIFMTNSLTGTAQATYSANRASTALSVAASGDKAIRQTKSRAIYQSGKSLLMFMTFIGAGRINNVTQSIGYFDAKNGVFLKETGAGLFFTRRTYVTGSAVDNDVPQSQWNRDRLDGSGASGITIDCSKPQILYADFEWLGVGRVRIGFVINGIPVIAHEFYNANSTLASVYMSNSNLPLRWEIEATGAISATHTLESICGTLASEGGYEIKGITTAADSGTSALSIGAGVTSEILAVRMQSTFKEYATMFVRIISAINATSGTFRWRLVLNPTETGAGSWSAVPNSIMEKNTTRTVTVDTGITISSGYVGSSSNQLEIDASPVLTAGTTVAGVTDVISLQITNIAVAPDSFYASLTMREVY